MNETNYFVERKPELMKFFTRLMKPGRKIIVKRYGVETGEVMINDFRSEFESLIPEMPKIRQDDTLLERQLILCTVYLAIYRSMKKQGKSVEDIWQLCHDIEEAMIKSIPGIIRWFAKRNIFSNKENNREIRSAKESQKHQYPEDFVFTYVEGDGGNFDYGIDMTECAMCKFYTRMDAIEFLPYICKTDYIFSEHFGYTFIRTKTLAQGHDRCDFRFKK